MWRDVISTSYCRSPAGRHTVARLPRHVLSTGCTDYRLFHLFFVAVGAGNDLRGLPIPCLICTFLQQRPSLSTSLFMSSRRRGAQSAVAPHTLLFPQTPPICALVCGPTKASEVLYVVSVVDKLLEPRRHAPRDAERCRGVPSILRRPPAAHTCHHPSPLSRQAPAAAAGEIDHASAVRARAPSLSAQHAAVGGRLDKNNNNGHL